MIKSYLSIAWRNIVKHKSFSAISILGLSLGMTCSLLIMLWVNDERSIDGFHQNENIYLVYERQYHDGIVDGGYGTPGMLAEEMKIKFPEVQYASAMGFDETSTFEANDKTIKEEGNFGSPDFFTLFSYPIIAGDGSTALQSPSGITISRKMAVHFFNSPEEAIGKTIRYENRKDFTVAAVFEDVSVRSSKKFDFILPYEIFLENNSWAREWGNNGPPAYLALLPGTDVDAFRSKIKNFIDLYDKQENFRIELDIQKYRDIYLHSNFEGGELVGGRIQYVVLFSVVAIFILLIACINFMNLSTARSIKRAKEIGIRKVVGAVRGALIRQFIGEAMLTVIISLIVALGAVALALPVFNGITQKHVELPLTSYSFWAGISSLVLITGIISGSYPALYLSSFRPASVLKGSLKFGNSALWFRKGLVVFQFVLSVILIVGTIVVTEQINYIQSINLGYNRENLIYIPLEGDLLTKYKVFKEQALNMPGIGSITRITGNPTAIYNSTGGVQWEGKDPNSRVQFTFAAVGYDFAKCMQADFVEGRDFSKDFASDSVGYIVNETALKVIGNKDPIGATFTQWGKQGTIVGIIKDFHFSSLHDPINPLVLRLGEDIDYGSVLVRTEAGKTKEALASLEKLCKELNPQFPFTYQFSDEEYQKLYKSEAVVGKLSKVFAFLGIFISCLGLLGLAMFTAEQRAREVGIRKVLGASIGSLFNLLSGELLVLVATALVVATPLAFWIMNNWLKDYAYRIDISLWIFLIAGVVTVLIALATISFQTIKVALINPVESLKGD